MKPLYLVLEGLYSYEKRVEIDFEKLCNAGLFGIFGETGSGKSSLLEAITLALFGHGERLGKKDNYNLMNLKAKRLYIQLIFVSQNEKYLYEIEMERDKKKSETVRTKYHKANKWEIDQWVPIITDNKTPDTARKILQLSYENFKRTIIIPQGKFQEFIKLKNTERTEMLSEIFNLSRFDLSEKVKYYLNNLERKIQIIEENIKVYEICTDENIEKTASAIEEKQNLLEKEKIKIQSLTKEITEQEQLKKLYTELHNQRQKLEELNTEKSRIDQLAQQLQLFEYCKETFGSLVEKIDYIATKIKESNSNLSQKEAKRKQITQELTEITDKKTILENEKEKKIPEFNRQQEEIKKIIELRKKQLELQEIKNILEKQKKEVDMLEIALINNQKLIDEKSNAIEKIPELNILYEALNWNEQKRKLTSEITQNQKNIDSMDKIITEKEQVIASHFQAIKKRENRNLDDINAINKVITDIEKENELLKNTIEHLTKSKALCEFAAQLTENKPCPLCGSSQHPVPLKPESVDNELLRCNEKINNNTKLIKYLSEQSKNIEKLSFEIDFHRKEKEKLTATKTKLEADYNSHISLVKDMNLYNTNTDEIEKLIKTYKQLDEEIKKLNKSNNDCRNKMDKTKEIYNEILLKKQTIDTQIDEISKGIDTNAINYYKNKPDDNLTNDYRNIEQKKEKIITQLNEITTLFNELTKNINQLAGIISTYAQQLRENEQQYEKYLNEYQMLLNNQPSNYDTDEKVRNILQQKINIISVRNQIEQFNQSYNIVINNITHLTEQIGNRKFDELSYQNLCLNLNNHINNRDTLNLEIGKLNNQLNNLKAGNVKLKQALIERDAIIPKIEKADIIKKLMRGQKFINFVLTRFLKGLVLITNRRLKTLFDRWPAEIAISEDNDFELIDHYNGSIRRSLETLSGGETFQVALCMALSLAEFIQRSEINFFFLDEGFGNLDSKTLQKVFETLRKLRSENRIVGLISHVEDLKQEIETYLTIEKTESGSTVYTSW